MRSLRRATILLLFALAAVFAAALPARARQLTIKNFNVAIDVQADSTIDVTETLTVNFEGEWRGLYRSIPVEYRGSMGLNYTLFVELKSIADESGNALRYEVSRQGQ